MNELVKDETAIQQQPANVALVPAKKNGVVKIEVTAESLRNVTGANDPKVARRLVGQLMSMQALEREPFDADMCTSAISLLGELEPKNATEGLLAVQMLGVHEVATRFLQLATVPGQSSEATDAHIAKITKLCRLFNEQLEAMAKLKGKTGQQKVTVSMFTFTTAERRLSAM